MVKALYEKYKVPMGILHSSWGGSSAEAWISTEGLKDFDNYLEKLNNLPAPLVPYVIKGVAWYQGETNADRGKEYQRLLTAITSHNL